MRFLLTTALLTLASTAQAAAPQFPLPPQAPAVDPLCSCGDNCKCKPGTCPGGCPVAFPAPPPAPPAYTRVCDASGCRIIPAASAPAVQASVGFPALAAAGQFSESRGGEVRSGGPIRRLFARFRGARGCCN